MTEFSKAGGSKGEATPQIGPSRDGKSGRPEIETEEPQSMNVGGTPHIALQDVTVGETTCPYCDSDNEAIREIFFDQTCAGCVRRMMMLPDARPRPQDNATAK